MTGNAFRAVRQHRMVLLLCGLLCTGAVVLLLVGLSPWRINAAPTIAPSAPVAASQPAASTPQTPPTAIDLPSSHVVAGVPTYEQHQPLSCEYAATSAVTAYYGKQIPETTFVDDIGFNANPDKGFRGQIDGTWGGIDDYGVYPGPILDDLKRRGFPNSYRFAGEIPKLKDAIAHDHPVVAWIVGTYGDSERMQETQDGIAFFLVPYEHAVTVYGYDDTGVWVLDVGDAMKEHVMWAIFVHAWMQLDGMALVPVP